MVADPVWLQSFMIHEQSLNIWSEVIADWSMNSSRVSLLTDMYLDFCAHYRLRDVGKRKKK